MGQTVVVRGIVCVMVVGAPPPGQSGTSEGHEVVVMQVVVQMVEVVYWVVDAVGSGAGSSGGGVVGSGSPGVSVG